MKTVETRDDCCETAFACDDPGVNLCTLGFAGGDGDGEGDVDSVMETPEEPTRAGLAGRVGLLRASEERTKTSRVDTSGEVVLGFKSGSFFCGGPSLLETRGTAADAEEVEEDATPRPVPRPCRSVREG